MTLRVTSSAGFGRRRIPDVEIVQRDTQVDATNQATFNFSVDVGALTAGKKVAIFVSGEDSTSFTIDSVTIDSVSATAQVQAIDGAGPFVRAEVWSAEIPSSSGTVTCTVSMSQTVNNATVHTVALKNLQSITKRFGGSDPLDAGNAASVASVTCPAGGFVGAIVHDDNNSGQGNCSWTGLTERYDAGPTNGAMSAANDLTATAFNATVTADYSTSGDVGVMAVASFR